MKASSEGLIEGEAGRMCLRRNYIRSSKCTFRGEREWQNRFVRTNMASTAGEGRRGEGDQHTQEGCKYRADEFLHPLPVMHDAMLLTLYTPTETTLFPRFLLRHLRLAVSEDLTDLAETRPRLFISIYFDHRSPHLYPSASSRPVTK